MFHSLNGIHLTAPIEEKCEHIGTYIDNDTILYSYITAFTLMTHMIRDYP